MGFGFWIFVVLLFCFCFLCIEEINQFSLGTVCFSFLCLGYGRDSYEHPTRVNTLPRQIPEVPWYMTGLVSIAIGGILPFGTVSIELYFIMTSIWFGKLSFQ